MSTKSYGEPGVPLHGVPCDRISWKVREYMNGAVWRGSRQSRNRLKTLAEADAIPQTRLHERARNHSIVRASYTGKHFSGEAQI